MTKEEFVFKVKALIESGELDKLEELYDEVLGLNNFPEVTTRGGEAVTVRWGTP